MSEIPETPENDIENTSEAPVITPAGTDIPPVEPVVPSKTDDDNVVISRTTVNNVVIAVVFFALGMLISGLTSSGSTVDEAAIEAAVESVLIDAGIIQPPADMAILVDDDPFIGPENAPIIIVEFSAYACPYCGRHYNETLVPLLENYGQYIRYVYRDFPSINPDVSYPASLAANCAREQGMFWEYHEQLFVNQSAVAQAGEAYMTQLASQVGLEMDAFSTCVVEQRYLQEVNDDFNTGVAMGVTGTPSFYINGQQHSGARPYAYFETVIQRELDRAGIDY